MPRPLPILCVCMKSCRKTLLWQANIILIGIKFYTVQKCSMQSKMPESNASLGPWWSPLAPACVRIRHVISNPPHSEKFQYPVELNTLIAFPKLCVILETGTLGSMQRVSSIPLQRLTSSETLLQLLASIISISSISWETQRIILSLSVLLYAGLNDRKNNSNRMKEHRTLKSQGMKPVNKKINTKNLNLGCFIFYDAPGVLLLEDILTVDSKI